jgi:hypothetical protein
MSTFDKTFANRAAQVTYMTTQDLSPEEPLPVNSTLSFTIPRKSPAVITALWNGDPSVAYGYRVTAPNAGTTDYTLDNNGDLESCANAASSQVDGIIGKSSSSSRKASVTIP